MSVDHGEVVVRVAVAGDVVAIAGLRVQWTAGAGEDSDFERRIADWLAAEGQRRTLWLAMHGDLPIEMASVLEYHRMPRPGRPDSRWGYISNMFVREDFRNRGAGSALLQTIIAAARDRGYARLVLSPAERALPFYRRARESRDDDPSEDCHAAPRG
jgi:GNAT superfamily N-acetyltransferase